MVEMYRARVGVPLTGSEIGGGDEIIIEDTRPAPRSSPYITTRSE